MFLKFKKLNYIFTSILGGFCLFILLLSLVINNTILSSSFHENFFIKKDIYSHVETTIKNSLNTFANSNISLDPTKKNELLKVLKIITTDDLIKTNVNKVRVDIFNYFNGVRKELPDIFLESQNSIESSPQDKDAYQAISNLNKLKKINLSTILTYINRTDISDNIMMIKFCFYIVHLIPQFALLAFLISLLIGIIFCRNFLNVLKWLANCILSTGIFSIVCFISIIIYIKFMLVTSIYPISMSIPLEKEFTLSYLKDCITTFSFYLLGIGILGIAVYFVLYFILNHFSKNIMNSYTMYRNFTSSNKTLTHLIYALIISFAFLTFAYKIYLVKKDFNASEFTSVINRLNNPVTEVISAKNDTIFDLRVKILDEQYQSPVSDIKVLISGTLSKNNQAYNKESITDKNGTINIPISQGSFGLTFVKDNLPGYYEVPMPYYFEIKKPGTTVVTITLKSTDTHSNKSYGLSEIDVLDKNNRPIENIGLSVVIKNSEKKYNEISSYTNSEGIAIFKLIKGIYEIKFIENQNTKNYILPKNFDIVIKENSISKYTLKLPYKK